MNVFSTNTKLTMSKQIFIWVLRYRQQYIMLNVKQCCEFILCTSIMCTQFIFGAQFAKFYKMQLLYTFLINKILEICIKGPTDLYDFLLKYTIYFLW